MTDNTTPTVPAEVAARSRKQVAQVTASTLFRLLLAGVMIAAGVLKVGSPLVSARAVQAYQIFPFEIAAYIGYALPVLEIILGIMLLVGVFTRQTAAVVGLIMLAFIAGIASAWARGLSIDCGCFGGGGTIAPENVNYLPKILQDTALFAAAAFLTWKPLTWLSLDNRLK